jgi:4-carboxymuconolactone decarboxylase
MSRLSAPDRGALSAEAQAIWDRIAATRSGGQMRGPSSIMMNVPELANRVMQVEDYFRTDAELPQADRELVILATAREWGARFAWARHEARAREVNVRPEAVEILRKKGGLDGLTPRERTLAEVVRSMLRTHELPDNLYQQAVDELGPTQLVETVALIGNYCTIGMFINGFEIPEDSPTF